MLNCNYLDKKLTLIVVRDRLETLRFMIKRNSGTFHLSPKTQSNLDNWLSAKRESSNASK